MKTDASRLIDAYRDIHGSRVYGASSARQAPFIMHDVRALRPGSIIDYGCGQSPLIDMLGVTDSVERVRYDPAIPAYSARPQRRFDLLINVDVLEHIREPDLDQILDEMRGLCRDAIIIVDTIEAKLVLPSGENAHVTIRPKPWWREKLGGHFPLLVPIAASGGRRAAFRTWRRTPLQSLSLAPRIFNAQAQEAWRRFVKRAGRSARKRGL